MTSIEERGAAIESGVVPTYTVRRFGTMRYKNPVLIEIFVECFFTPSSFVGARIMDVVPALKNSGFDDIELVSSLQVTPGEPTMLPRVRCWSKGRKRLVQLSDDCVIVNLLGDYSGWPTFMQLLEMTLGLVSNTIGSLPLKSINLHTIDRFTVNKGSYTLDQYLDVGGLIVPGWYKGAKEALDITLGWGALQEENWNRRINVKVRIGESVTIEFRVAQHSIIGQGVGWKSVLDKLHENSHTTFEALITDKTRNEVMGGRIS